MTKRKSTKAKENGLHKRTNMKNESESSDEETVGTKIKELAQKNTAVPTPIAGNGRPKSLSKAKPANEPEESADSSGDDANLESVRKSAQKKTVETKSGNNVARSSGRGRSSTSRKAEPSNAQEESADSSGDDFNLESVLKSAQKKTVEIKSGNNVARSSGRGRSSTSRKAEPSNAQEESADSSSDDANLESVRKSAQKKKVETKSEKNVARSSGRGRPSTSREAKLSNAQEESADSSGDDSNLESVRKSAQKKTVETKSGKNVARSSGRGRPSTSREAKPSNAQEESAHSSGDDSNLESVRKSAQKKTVETKSGKNVARSSGRGRPSTSPEAEPSNAKEESSNSSGEDFNLESVQKAAQKKSPGIKSKNAVAHVNKKKPAENVEKSNGKSGTPKSNSKKGQDTEEYEVEKIIDHEVDGRHKLYLIRWKGYGSEDDTWENERNIHCPDLIAKYRETHPDDQPIPPLKSKKRKKKKATPLVPKKIKIDQMSDYKEPDTDDDIHWEVGKILDVYFHRDKTREFLIRWKDYSANSDTWEPEEHLDCKDMIDKFMEKLDRRAIVTERELRVAPTHTQRFTLMENTGHRRLSKRFASRQRVLYFDAE